MLKILIWQVSGDTAFKDKALKILEKQNDGIEIVGAMTSNAPLKVDFVGNYDVLLVVGAKKADIFKKAEMSAVRKTAAQLNLPVEKILGDWIVCIPGFTLEKYRKLQQSRLSIFSVNCFGGDLSNRLNLTFRSPFVNLYLSNEDFIKFMREPHTYLEKPLTYHGQKFDSKKTFQFPIAKCADILLNMMHYKNFEESVEAWERRKPRINWDNIFVIMWTESSKILEQFDELPYEKKACFVPFKSDLNSAWYVNRDLDKKSKRFVDVFINFAKGRLFYYDLFDMLLYGKKTPLIDM